jgi:hypothetical protein
MDAAEQDDKLLELAAARKRRVASAASEQERTGTASKTPYPFKEPLIEKMMRTYLGDQDAFFRSSNASIRSEAPWTPRHTAAIQKYFPNLPVRPVPRGKASMEYDHAAKGDYWNQPTPKALNIPIEDRSRGIHEAAHAFATKTPLGYKPSLNVRGRGPKVLDKETGKMIASDEMQPEDEFLSVLAAEASLMQQGLIKPTDRYRKRLTEHGPRYTGVPEKDIDALKDWIYSITGKSDATLQPTKQEAFQYGAARTPTTRAQALGAGYKAWKEYQDRAIRQQWAESGKI